MVDKKYIGSGFEGILYKLGDESVLKVYHGRGGGERISKIDAENEFLKMRIAYKKGINVPKPMDLVKINLKEEDIKPIKKIEYNLYGTGVESDVTVTLWNPSLISGSEQLVGQKRYAIKREYIEGIPLSHRLFPSIRTKKKMKDLYKKFDESGLILLDRFSKNFVITPAGKIYLIDCSKLENLCDFESPENSLLTKFTSASILGDFFLKGLYLFYP